MKRYEKKEKNEKAEERKGEGKLNVDRCFNAVQGKVVTRSCYRSEYGAESNGKIENEKENGERDRRQKMNGGYVPCH